MLIITQSVCRGLRSKNHFFLCCLYPYKDVSLTSSFQLFERNLHFPPWYQLNVPTRSGLPGISVLVGTSGPHRDRKTRPRLSLMLIMCKKNAAFRLRPPRSLRAYPTIAALFHKRLLLPVSRMKLRPTEGYYSHAASLPTALPCTITVFKGSHSYLCSFPTFPFPFRSFLCQIFSLCIGLPKK